MQALYDFIFEKPDIRRMKNELQQTLFFSNLTGSEMSTISKHLQLRSFKKGDRVFYEGDPGSALFIILKGEVQITKLGQGKRNVFANLSKGMFFGELALVFDTPRTASAIASEDALVACLFKHDFEKIIKYHPLLGNKLLKTINTILAQRLSATIERVK